MSPAARREPVRSYKGPGSARNMRRVRRADRARMRREGDGGALLHASGSASFDERLGMARQQIGKCTDGAHGVVQLDQQSSEIAAELRVVAIAGVQGEH